MKRLLHLLNAIVILAFQSCDPRESQYEGPAQLNIEIVNNSGIAILEKDNWGTCDTYGHISKSERVIEKEQICYLWNYMPGIYRFSEFISFLKNECPNAFVELYEYDTETLVPGKLLKRWSLSMPETHHWFFDEASFVNNGSVTYIASLGIYTFTIIPDDLVTTD